MTTLVPQNPGPRQQLTYRVSSRLGGRTSFDGLFQVQQMPPVTLGHLIALAGTTARVGTPVNAYFEHELAITNTGSERVSEPITIALEGDDLSGAEQAVSAHQVDRKSGGPELQLKPRDDFEDYTFNQELTSRAFVGHLDLHPDERVVVTLTTMVPRELNLRSMVGGPCKPELRCRGVDIVVEEPRSSLTPRANPQVGIPTNARHVFIGHGGSLVWLQLRDLLRDRLGLQWEEYDRTSAAGINRQDRLATMQAAARFAFIVLTAEDEQADATMRARENAVHELGYFQGSLTFRRAIALLEDGCNEFSNLAGLGQIRFPKGNLIAKSEAIRAVLEREGILPPK